MSPILLLTANRMPLLKLHDHGHRHWDKAGPPAHSRGKSPGSSASSETARLGPAQRDATRRQRQHPTAQGLRTPVSTPRERQISELQRMPPLPNRSQRRRRARISSEYYSSSDAYTPLYPSPIESVYTPAYPTEGSRGRSRSEGPRPGARDASWLAVDEGRFENGRDPDVARGSGYVGVQTGRRGERGGSVTREAGSRRCPPWTRTRWRGRAAGVRL